MQMLLENSPYKRYSPAKGFRTPPKQVKCQHEEEVRSLRSSVEYLDYNCRLLWGEIAKLKAQQFSMPLSQQVSMPQIHPLPDNQFQGEPTEMPYRAEEEPSRTSLSVSTTADNQLTGPSCSNSQGSSSSTNVHGGYTKAQIMDILKYIKCAKKGVNCLFRKLFCKEEVEGRSLGGQKNNRGEVRPALEDRAKLNFLEASKTLYSPLYTGSIQEVRKCPSMTDKLLSEKVSIIINKPRTKLYQREVALYLNRRDPKNNSPYAETIQKIAN